MAKLCMIRRENKRKLLVEKYKKKRAELILIVKGMNYSLEDKEVAQQKLQQLPKDSSPVRRRNRCWITGRPRGVYRRVGLCRNKFREFVMNGDVPGARKASW